jgi:hypothetical protein
VSLTHTFCRCLCFQHLILNPSTPANADRLHLDDRQYQSVGFYKAEKRLIDRYEEVSDGIKADISPDPLPLSQEMKKQKNNYEGWFTGHFPSPLQDGKSYTEKDGRATAFTTRMYENAVNSGLPSDKQLVLGQMFDYFTDCTLGQVPFLADGENYCHNEHYLKGRLADDAERESIGGICGSMSSAASSLMLSTGNLLALAFSLLASCHISFFHQLSKRPGRWQLTTSRSKALLSSLISS